MAKGSWIDPRAGKQLFGDYADEWRAVQVHRRGTTDRMNSAFEHHILPWFATKPIAAIRKSTIQGWVKDREKELAPATLEVVYSFVAGVFRSAVEDQLIASTPCTGIKLPKKPKTQVVPAAVDEVQAIVAALPARYRAVAIVAAGAGLRSGEILGLTVPRVDFLRRTIRVDQQLRLPNRGPLYVGPPKTDASYRPVPIPDVVVDALAAHLAQFPAVTVELGDTTAGGAEVSRRHAFIFTNEHGTPVRRSPLSRDMEGGVGEGDRRTRRRDGPRRPDDRPP